MRFHNLHKFLDFPQGFALIDAEVLSEAKYGSLEVICITPADSHRGVGG
jgi:hypothetical protein